MGDTSRLDWSRLTPDAIARLSLPAQLEVRWQAQTRSRSNQHAPPGDWNVCLWMAGRGFGKTRCLTEWARWKALEPPGRWRIAIVAPTWADARDTVVEGESGLLRILPSELIAGWNRSLGDLRLRNGTHFKLFSADVPERLRGPQHHYAICDELAAWERPEAWDMLLFGLRLGRHPQVCIATTPKPTKLIRELVGRAGTDPDDVALIRGNTFENEANLAPSALANLKFRYEGTRLGRQELMGELLEDREGALFSQKDIDAARRGDAPGSLHRVVVAVDPAMADQTPGVDRHLWEGLSESGIVVVGVDGWGHCWVLDDLTCRASPEETMRRVARAFHDHKADRVVFERNQGGDYLPALLATVDASIPTRCVSAMRGKALRAEPVASLYEQGKVHHVGHLPELEDQMVTWAPGDPHSPDRLDALVWAVTELVLKVSGTEFYFAALAPPCPACGVPVRDGHVCGESPVLAPTLAGSGADAGRAVLDLATPPR